MQPEAITQGPKYERDWDIWRQEEAPNGMRVEQAAAVGLVLELAF